ncbi:hypothetical protein [Actinoplanes couchii]|uniref:Uncharacterized protein n=1 Tax=Actinoplanes couchii TaxID=403638 RepID=A0ABQ3XQT0_9ACTN|nr:hypothetical protein [Actinoplanes couchii]MDR6317464.1 hypothetical protein [Actinoplanes couchii]GID60765.1 hypothetical protein Aco03nite_091690 [Actinoplanes couchii]
MTVFHTSTRFLTGAAGVALGLYTGGINITEPEPDWHITLFATVTLLGGILLLAQARNPTPPRDRP